MTVRLTLDWDGYDQDRALSCALCGWDDPRSWGRLVVDDDQVGSLIICDQCQATLGHLLYVLGGTGDGEVEFRMRIRGLKSRPPQWVQVPVSGDDKPPSS